MLTATRPLQAVASHRLFLHQDLECRRGFHLRCHAQKTRIHIQTQRQIDFGEGHKIVGNVAELGGWKIDDAPSMEWNEGSFWTLDLELPAGSDLEFKCVKVNGGDAEWESGNNHTLQVPNGEAKRVSIGFTWSQDELEFLPEPEEQDKLDDGQASSSTAETPHETQQHQERAQPSSGQAPHKESEDDRPDHLRWRGRQVSFMKANEHSKKREGKWDASSLEGAAKTIVQGDEKGANWLSKMQVAKKVLVDDCGKYPDEDALANAFIYLQWINSGAIECKEGGGHYRPNKHAEIARDIFRALERCIGEPKLEPLLHLLARNVQTKLPSFTEEYTQSTPLTRIRDIAHRNDIPHELKQEIKHTIQNKLHRNAGPEDLVATEAMLVRVSNDGGYNQDFVQEFNTFTAELRDFFNAGSFADMLKGLQAAMDDQEQQIVDRFRDAKAKADAAGDGTSALNDLVGCLHSLTSLRATLLSRLASGLRNDASDASIAMRQKFRLGEIRAEDYAFVLVSRILNILDGQGNAESLSEGPDSSWALPLGAALLSIRQVGLGGWNPKECMALENEIGSWQEAGEFRKQSNALRLKATLERLQRLTQGYTDNLLKAFPSRAEALGNALGLPQEPIQSLAQQVLKEQLQVFTESEVRASLVFQLSKLCSLLLKAARLAVGGAEWDAVVAGEACGKLVEVDRIEPGALDEAKEPVVLLVKRASGDEEIGAAGVDLKGVILCHGLPHLSHLGVRSRQEQVVFVACEDDTVIEASVRPLIGQQVRLNASMQSVTIEAAKKGSESSSSNGKMAQQEKRAGSKVMLKKAKTERRILDLEHGTVESCGSKAAACAELARLAEKGDGFSTPSGICLPFGNMEYAIEETGRKQEFEAALEEAESADLKGGALDKACCRLMQIVSDTAHDLAEAGSHFGEDATVIVRSSANVEDLAGMSGAGLYDSIANIRASDSTALSNAISKVWASLYTRRAILARRAAGVPQNQAAMAVLIQEQLQPDYSFVLHTSNPLDKDENVLCAEIAVGLGETLASGTRGSPWRLSVNKLSGEVETLAFSNFSQALTKGKSSQSSGAYSHNTVDYSKQRLSIVEDVRGKAGKKLGVVGDTLQRAFEGPQDVEGVFVGDIIYIVQTRPQP